jgi:hypothetical protein
MLNYSNKEGVVSVADCAHGVYFEVFIASHLRHAFNGSPVGE